jgi:hypothetical protein
MKRQKKKRVYRVMIPTYYVTANSKKEVKERIDKLFSRLIKDNKSACHENRWIKDIGMYGDHDRYIWAPPKGYEPEYNEVCFWEDNR